MNPIKILCIGLGFLFFGLAAVGVVLPVLPTTPFLLLASFFFMKGSDRFNTWFMSTQLYQDHVDTFLKHRSMTLKIKLGICSLATVMFALSFILVDVIYVRVFLVAMALFMYYYFSQRIKTVSPEEYTRIKSEEAAAREGTVEPIPLRDTLDEVRSMHEEIIEESCKAPHPSSIASNDK